LQLGTKQSSEVRHWPGYERKPQFKSDFVQRSRRKFAERTVLVGKRWNLLRSLVTRKNLKNYLIFFTELFLLLKTKITPNSKVVKQILKMPSLKPNTIVVFSIPLWRYNNTFSNDKRNTTSIDDTQLLRLILKRWKH
jgi:hypothetical protein